MKDYKKMWDERYSQNDLVYGKDPNEYFQKVLDKLKPGRLLMPGDGEGRNSIYAAKKGWDVTSVDFSSVAVNKAMHYAEHEKVDVNFLHEDLSKFNYPEEYYDAVGIIFFHLQSPEKEIIHENIAKSIKKGGIIIAEVFSNNQLEHESGGPRNKNALYTLEEIAEYYKDFDHIELLEAQIELKESKFHSGPASVIRLFGKKNSTSL